MFRYGVFQLGQIWCVVTGKGANLGFTDRASAIANAARLLAAHRARGGVGQLLIQDEFGGLSTEERPPSPDVADDTDRQGQDPVTRLRPRSVRLRLVD